MNLDEIIVRATQICVGRGQNPMDSPLLDAGLTLEALYPHALRMAIGRDLNTGGTPQDYIRTHQIEVSEGVGSLPDTVLRRYLDTSFLPDFPYAAHVPYPDYGRQVYSNLVAYYSDNVIGDAGKFYFNYTLPSILEPDCSAQVNSSAIAGTGDPAFTASLVGMRLYLYDTTAGRLICNAIIASFTSAAAIAIAGEALATTSGIVAGFFAAQIFSTGSDAVNRSVADLVTVKDSATVTSATANFTSADIGRRLRVSKGAVTVIDAIILSVTNSTTVVLGALATVSQAGNSADILASTVRLSTPSLPDVPASSSATLNISPKLGEDVILIMAGALTGEIKAADLLNYR